MQQTIRELENKIARLQKERAVFAVKSKLMGDELLHYRARENREYSLVDELLERQRELNVMLNRSNIMLARAQDATAMLSLEFGDLARALPESVQIEVEGHTETIKVEDRVNRINDLFRKTGQLADELKEQLQTNAEAQLRPGHVSHSVDPFVRQTQQTASPTPVQETVPSEQYPPQATMTSADNGSSAAIDSSDEHQEQAADTSAPEPQEGTPTVKVFKNWATTQSDQPTAQPGTPTLDAIVTEQEQADIEAVMAEQQGGFWARLKGRLSG